MNNLPIINEFLDEDYLMSFDENITKGMVKIIIERAKKGDVKCIEFILDQLQIFLLPSYEFCKRTQKWEITAIPITGYTVKTEITENKKEK